MDQSESKYIIRFIYDFYKYCKDTCDSKGTREKYRYLLPKYVAQFASERGKKIDVSNMAREQTNSPITIEAKYQRWKNA